MIPSQKSVDALMPGLRTRDGFLRYKVIAALDRLRRADDSSSSILRPSSQLVVREARHVPRARCRSTTTSCAESCRPTRSSHARFGAEDRSARIRIYQLLSR